MAVCSSSAFLRLAMEYIEAKRILEVQEGSFPGDANSRMLGNEQN